MKRILIISAFEPSNKTAGQALTKRFLEDVKADHIVDVISFSIHKDTITSKASFNFKLSHISRLVGIFSIPFLHPIFTSRFSFLKALYIRRISKDYDVLIFNFSQILIYSFFISHQHKFFLAHDVITQNYSRRHGFFAKFSEYFCYISEFFLLNVFKGNIYTFSQKDTDLISRWYGKKSSPVSFYLDPLIFMDESNKSDSFVFYGAWGRRENNRGLIWFLKNVMPMVNKNITFEVIGPGVSDEILKAADIYGTRFIFRGFVDNPYIYLRSCKALLAPLFEGAGVKVKVIEALATGTLVVGTEVSFEGIDPEFLTGCLTCITAQDFAVAINSLDDSGEKKLRRKAFQDRYSKNTLGEALRGS